MAGHGRSARFARAVLVALALACVGSARLAEAQQPTSIAFVMSNGSCNDEGLDVPSTLDFYVNEHLVGSAPARQECTCAPPEAGTVVFDAPEILALLDPATCNTFRVELTPGAAPVKVGDVLVRVTTAGAAAETCLYDLLRQGGRVQCGDEPCKLFYGSGNFLTTGSRDPDGDGIPSGIGTGCDDCNYAYDPQQADSDGDGIGDFCDACTGQGGSDPDGDGVCAPFDVCPITFDPDQSDADDDGIGDECDFCDGPGRADHDGDGICSTYDDCQFSYDPDQSDRDGDGVGDVCDICPDAVDPSQPDVDQDGIGDACDPVVCYDFDGDGLGFPAAPPWDDSVCPSDNCADWYNPEQEDADGDGYGDACDFCVGAGAYDSDDDGVCNDADPCPYTGLQDPRDSDGDGTPDACDDCVGQGTYDSDGDGVCNEVDGCYFLPDPEQLDQDGDGIGDACDKCPTVRNASSNISDQPDADFDGIGDACDPVQCIDFDFDGFGTPQFALVPFVADCPDDVCPDVPNPGQEDADGDGVGDVCDGCPTAYDPAQVDTDRDGLDDACDPVTCLDRDGDGFGDPGAPQNQCPVDACPFAYDPDQADRDGDGIGDVCDPCPDDGSVEPDADGVCDTIDNCPDRPNPGQEDADGDGVGDQCDSCTDPDHDGFRSPFFANPFADACPVDDCPNVANADQRDTDRDRIGDACDPADAPLEIEQARVWAPAARAGQRRPRGRIQLRGRVALQSAQDAFSAADGLAVLVRDARSLERTLTFDAAQCRTLASGAIRCRGGERRSLVVDVTPLRRASGRELAFSVRAKRLDIAPGFTPPLVVTLADRPGTILRGTDRTGLVPTCTFTGGVPCVSPYGSTRAAFLADPGASLTDP